MKNILLSLSFIALHAVASTADIPQGISHWFHSTQPDPASAKNGRKPFTLELWVVRKGDLICGIAKEEYGLESWDKSPSGRITGYKVGKGFDIQFNDSFSEATDLGVAKLKLVNGELEIETSKQPEHGYLALDEHPLQFVGNKFPGGWSSISTPMTKCVTSKELQKSYLGEVE